MKVSKPFMKTTDGFLTNPKRYNQTWVTLSELFPGDEKTYDVRFISEEYNTLEEDLLIAGDELEGAIRNSELDWNDEHEGFWHEPKYGLSGEKMEKECRLIYDHIFFFTDNTTLNEYSDHELITEMKKENPSFFK